MQNYVAERQKANEGCSICPCCKRESIRSSAYRNLDLNMRVDLYRCNSCGTEWESEPYQYMDFPKGSDLDFPINQVLSGLEIVRVNLVPDPFRICIEWQALSTSIRSYSTFSISPSNQKRLVFQDTRVPNKYLESVGKVILNRLARDMSYDISMSNM